MSNKTRHSFILDNHISNFGGVLGTPRQHAEMWAKADAGRDKPAVTAGMFYLIERDLPAPIVAIAGDKDNPVFLIDTTT